MSFFVNGCGLIRMFQYRKRYGLHAMQVGKTYTPEACKFQYRKRYGLHAMIPNLSSSPKKSRFNTASGMDCMQYGVSFDERVGGGV